MIRKLPTYIRAFFKLPTPKNGIETLYQSKGKTLDGNPFMSVKRARGYYEYAERGGKNSIAFVLYDRAREKFLLINESKPPLDESTGTQARLTTAFGGSCDMNVTSEEICRVETMEETGYVVTQEEINYVGSTMVSTQMSQMCDLYLVDVTGIEKTKVAEYETSVEGVGNSVRWMTDDEVMENEDWKSIFIMSQSIHKMIVI